jgi:hypothetical protein
MQTNEHTRLPRHPLISYTSVPDADKSIRCVVRAVMNSNDDHKINQLQNGTHGPTKRE